MQNVKPLWILNLFVILIGVWGIGDLVWSEFQHAHTCPKLLGIPACYFIFFFIVAVLVSHLKVLKDKNFLYFLFGGIAWLIAVMASYMQYNELAQCPKTESGFPLCYGSFALFGVLLLLKVVEMRNRKFVEK